MCLTLTEASIRRLPFPAVCALAALAGCNPDNLEPTPHSPANPALPAPTVTATSDTVPPAVDALIRTSARHSNHGGAQTMMVKITQSQDDSTRVVIRFDQAAIVAAIGSGTLTRATLELGIEQSGTESENRLDAHRIVQPWTEFGVTWRCGTDLNLANVSADCPSTKWRMSGPDMDAFVATRTDRAHLNPGEAGVAKFNVTADVQAFLGGAANYGWVVMTADATSRAVVWSRETAVKPRLVLSVTRNDSEPVPAQAPDTIPAWFGHDSSWSTNGFQYLKHIIAVDFKPGTSQADRSAAVALVSGQVVGGWRTAKSEGTYAVKVDGVDPELVFQKIERLQALPQVRSAAVDPLISTTYLRPQDGAGWLRSEWQLRADSVQAVNPRWALEAIAAPMAWGCETGSTAARITVIDHNFDATEIEANLVTPLPQLGAHPLDTVRHGTAMTNIIAARGNDGTGMTGVMWEAGVTAIDVPGSGRKIGARQALEDLSSAMFAAIGHPAVINISLGTFWDPLPGQGARIRAQDSVRFKNSWAGAAATLTGVNPHVLLVISAGNQNDRGQQDDAWWSGWPQLRDSLPGQVLVVGSSNASRARAWFSSRGPTVDVYAPGDSVYTHGPSPSTLVNAGPSSGDSHAAAVATGIAGLLLSFDPRLTGPEVRNLMLEGADSGQRVVSPTTKKLLDAHHALKLAARQPGAPLCGNRIWANAGFVYANRSNGPEELFAHDGDDRGVFALAARHGGREIDMLVWSAPERTFKLSASGGWFRSSEPTQLFANQSGVANSLWGLSHDGDKEAFIDISAFNSSRILRMKLFSNGTTTQTSQDQVLPQLQEYPDTIAGIGRGTNDEYLLPWAVAYSPTDDHAVVAVSVHRTTITFNGSGETPCPWSVPDPDTGAPSDKCFDSITREMQAVKADLWDYPLPSGDPRHILTLPNTVVNSVAMSEDGSTMIVNEGMKHEKFDALPSGPEGCSPTQPGVFGYCVEANRTESNATCSVTYRSLETGTILEPRIPAVYACELPVGAMAPVKANGGMKPRSLRRP